MFSTHLKNLTPDTTVQDLPLQEFWVDINTIGQTIAEEFAHRPELQGVIITGVNRLAVLSRRLFFEQMGQLYGVSVYARRPIRVMLEAIDIRPLVLPGDTSINEAAQAALQRDPDLMYEPIIIQRSGIYRLLDIDTLLLAQSQLFSHLQRNLESAQRELEARYALSEQRGRELAEAKEMAEMANRAKSDFLAKMSHELRTPLNGILGYTQILRRDQDLNAQQTEGIDIIHQSGEHLLNLINDILDLAKIEAGKMELYPVAFHLPRFLNAINGIIQMRAQQKGLDYHNLIPDNLPAWIEADEKRLRQVLMNLLSNAVKFTSAGQVTMSISVEAVPPYLAKSIQGSNTNSTGEFVQLHFEVRDTGVGMTPAQLSHALQPFEQVGDFKKRAEGTGLGLSICRQLIRLMGSDLSVHSRVGDGSRFWFTLNVPLVHKDDDKPVVPTRKVIGYQGPRRTVLVVDDKRFNRIVLVRMLKNLDFQTVEAEDGAEAIRAAHEHRPDIILMDLVMPEVTGLEATAALRKSASFDHTTIIATSASAYAADREESLRVGCDDFLTKPVNAPQLLMMLKKYLELAWIYEDEAAQPESAA